MLDGGWLLIIKYKTKKKDPRTHGAGPFRMPAFLAGLFFGGGHLLPTTGIERNWAASTLDREIERYSVILHSFSHGVAEG